MNVSSLGIDGVDEAVQQVISHVKTVWKQYQGQEPIWDVIMAFVHAIDWKEPWIVGILVSHAVLLLLVLILRKNTTFLGVVFFSSALIIYNGENLNSLGAEHWRSFAKQPYFDQNGIFFGAVVAAPLLLLMFCILVNYLLTAASMMVQAKRREVMMRGKQRAQQEQQEAKKDK